MSLDVNDVNELGRSAANGDRSAFRRLATLLDSRSIPVRNAAEMAFIEALESGEEARCAASAAVRRLSGYITRALDPNHEAWEPSEEGPYAGMAHLYGNEYLSAARLLGEIGDQRATPVLLKLLSAPGEVDGQWAAATALGKLKDPAAVPALIEALHSDGLVLPVRAATALGEINTPEAKAALVKVLYSGGGSVSGFQARYGELDLVWAARDALGLPEGAPYPSGASAVEGDKGTGG